MGPDFSGLIFFDNREQKDILFSFKKPNQSIDLYERNLKLNFHSLSLLIALYYLSRKAKGSGPLKP